MQIISRIPDIEQYFVELYDRYRAYCKNCKNNRVFHLANGVNMDLIMLLVILTSSKQAYRLLPEIAKLMPILHAEKFLIHLTFTNKDDDMLMAFHGGKALRTIRTCLPEEPREEDDSQNESKKEVYNDVEFAKSFCSPDSSNQTHHVPDDSSHTTNTHEIAVKRIDGAEWCLRKQQTEAIDSLNKSEIKNNNDEGFSQSIYLSDFSKQRHHVLDGSSKTTNTHNVTEKPIDGKRYRPNDEQRKTEHGLIQLKSEDSNAKNMSMSFLKSSTVQNESEKEVYNDVGFAKSFCQSDSSNQTQHVPDVSSHTTNTNDIAVKRIDGTCAELYPLKQKTETNYSRNESESKDNNGKGFSQSICSPSFRNQRPDGSSHTANIYDVTDKRIDGKRYRPNDEQRKTEHGLIQLKSEDANATNTLESFSPPSTAQDESYEADSITDAGTKHDVVAESCPLKQQTEIIDSQNESEIKDNNDVEFSQSICLPASHNQAHHVPDVSSHTTNIYDVAEKRIDAGVRSFLLKEQTETNDSQNETEIKDNNDEGFSESICSLDSPNQRNYVPDGSLHKTNTHDVAEKGINGKRYRPNDEQRKTEHGLIQLKSEDANTTNTSESFSPPSTAQDESSEADTITDAGKKHDVAGARSFLLKEQTETTDSQNETKIKDNNDEGFSESICSLDSPNQKYYVLDVSLQKTSTYDVAEKRINGKRYRPNDEQRKTEHGLIQLKSEDANTTNTSESVSPPSTAQDESSEADTITDAGKKHDVEGAQSCALKEQTETIDSQNESDIKDNNDVEFSQSICLPASPNQTHHVPVVSSHTANIYDVTEERIDEGAQSCALKEQTETIDSQNESDIKDNNDVEFSQTICLPASPNQTHHVPVVSSHTANIYDVTEKRIDAGDRSFQLKEQTKTTDSQNETQIKDNNDEGFSESICSLDSPNQKYYVLDGSLHKTNIYDVAEKRIDGKRYRPNNEQRKTEHGLILLKSEDANTTNTSESFSPPSTAHDKSSEADTITDAGKEHDVDHGLNQQTAEDVIATKSNASLSPTSAAQMENFKAYATKDTATCKKYDVTKIKTAMNSSLTKLPLVGILLLLIANVKGNEGGSQAASKATMRKVEKCPATLNDWENRGKAMQCKNNLTYHCLPTEWGNETVDVCAKAKYITCHCAEYNTGAGLVQENLDTLFPPPLENCSYLSNKFYVNGCDGIRRKDIERSLSTIDSSTRTTTILLNSSTTIENHSESDESSWTILVVIIISLSSLGFIIIIIIWQTKRKKSSPISTASNSETTLDEEVVMPML